VTSLTIFLVQIDVKENHVKNLATPLVKLGRRAVAAASSSGPSCCDQRSSRLSAMSLTSSSSLSDGSTGSQKSMLSPSSNFSYSQEDLDSSGKPNNGHANLEIHEVKVVFVKVRTVMIVDNKDNFLMNNC